MATYGFTTTDVSHLNDKIEFTNFELVESCKLILNGTEPECTIKIGEMGLTQSKPDFIDSECDTETTIIGGLIASLGKIVKKTKVEQKQLEIMLWILRKRKLEVKNLLRTIKDYKFSNAELQYKTMILVWIFNDSILTDPR